MTDVKTWYGREWVCRCDCGNEITAISANLASGKVRSCGCFANDRREEVHMKHGRFNTPIYNTWASMLARCRNPKNKDYRNYGGRGITVCAEWHDFAAFLSDMGEPPAPGYSIDRIDNNGNYEVGNCRWATASEQGRNRRPRTGMLCGVSRSKNGKNWDAHIGWGGSKRALGTFGDWFDAVCARKSAEAAFLSGREVNPALPLDTDVHVDG